jgi:hypothetical protein
MPSRLFKGGRADTGTLRADSAILPPGRRAAANRGLAEVRRGILTGDTAGNFNPDSDITRSESATVISVPYPRSGSLLGIDDPLSRHGGQRRIFYYVAARIQSEERRRFSAQATASP